MIENTWWLEDDTIRGCYALLQPEDKSTMMSSGAYLSSSNGQIGCQNYQTQDHQSKLVSKGSAGARWERTL